TRLRNFGRGPEEGARRGGRRVPSFDEGSAGEGCRRLPEARGPHDRLARSDPGGRGASPTNGPAPGSARAGPERPIPRRRRRWVPPRPAPSGRGTAGGPVGRTRGGSPLLILAGRRSRAGGSNPIRDGFFTQSRTMLMTRLESPGRSVVA